MEFNLELAINAGSPVFEPRRSPIVLAPRKGESKLRTFRDGVAQPADDAAVFSPTSCSWRPARRSSLAVGLLIHVAVLLGFVRFGGRPASGVTAVFATIFSVVGFEILSLGLHTKTYSWSRRFDRGQSCLGRILSALHARDRAAAGRRARRARRRRS